MRFNLRVVLIGLVALVAAGVFLPGLGIRSWFTPSVSGGGEKFATLVIDYGSAGFVGCTQTTLWAGYHASLGRISQIANAYYFVCRYGAGNK